MSSKRRRSLKAAFGGEPPRGDQSESGTYEHSTGSRETVSQVEEVKLVPNVRGGEMVEADKPVNMTLTVTARERYLWTTLGLKRHGRATVSILQQRMDELMEEG